MNKKIIVKIIFIIILFLLVVLFDYYIYMFIKEDSKNLPNSVEYVEKDIYTISKEYVETFFNLLNEENYNQAFELLHESTKEKLFDSNIEKFENKIKAEFFNKELGSKEYAIKDGNVKNVNEKNIFHAYYEVNVNCSNETLKDTSYFYKDRTIFVDVVKNNGDFKIVLNFSK